MCTVIENADTHTYTLSQLERINEQQQRIDELLCEAVEKRSMKAAIILLDYANSNLRLEAFDQAAGCSNAASDICIKWKEKRDIQPLILSAQNGLPDFIKLFLSRGYHIMPPHEASCKCQGCELDPLRRSKERIMLYKAISNPVLICLTCADPFVSSFRLCTELDKLKCIEDSYENEYEELKLRCQDFCMGLLDEVSNTDEQYTLLNMTDEPNHDRSGDKRTPTLKLLKSAIQYKQKKFVAHSIPQHFITSLVFNDVTKWRFSGWAYRLMYILFRAILFPVTSLLYILYPYSWIGKSIQQPLVRFIHGASSFVAFLGLLASLATIPSTGIRIGKEPSALECVIFIWLISLLVAEINQLYHVGRVRYFSSGWNLMDITMIFLMLLSWITWGLLYFIQSEISITNVLLVRSLANGLFTFGTVMSFFRLVYLCQIARFLGLLQLCLGKMIEVIFQFAFISCVVLWSFSVGMVFLYNSRQNPAKVAMIKQQQNATSVQALLNQGFHGLSTTLVTLAWASLNMVGLDRLKVFDDGSIVYLWSSLLFTLYYGVSMIILLNMLIAMMSNSYQQIENNIEVEHKYAKTQLWVDYIGYENFLPCPFNIIPTWRTLKWLARKLSRKKTTSSNAGRCDSYQLQETGYQKIIKKLVKKYLKSKHNVILDDVENEKWKDRQPDHDGEFENYVKNCLQKLAAKETRFPIKKTVSLEDSGLDITFPGESTAEPAKVPKTVIK